LDKKIKDPKHSRSNLATFPDTCGRNESASLCGIPPSAGEDEIGQPPMDYGAHQNYFASEVIATK
jgi:hypothetical protein